MDQNIYRNLVAGTDKSFGRSILRCSLRAISRVYSSATMFRNWMYDLGLLRTHRSTATVISIGNITTGGTGKTPLVIWVCKFLSERKCRCAVLTRGYKTEHGKLTDEPAILAKSCGDARVIVDSDRVRSSRKAVSESKAEVLVLDDGFQHRRLGRDLDIVTVDATCPFGYGRVLPAGMLREPLRGLKRADAVVITRYEQAQPEHADTVVEQIRRINADAVIAKAVHEHPYAVMIKGKKMSIKELCTKKIFAFCGIGNPNAFLNNIEALGCQIVGHIIYNDHHDYTSQDIDDIYEQARYLGAEVVLSTEKDWVKTALLVRHNDDIISAYLAMQLRFAEGGDQLKELIARTLENKHQQDK